MNLLEKYTAKVVYNINTMKQCNKFQDEVFTSGKELTAALIINLLIAYNFVSSSTFNVYMKTQQDAYVDCKQEITEDRLMDMALNKYQNLIESENWKVSSVQDSQIFALTAEIDTLKQK